jgi:hypothetical protein
LVSLTPCGTSPLISPCVTFYSLFITCYCDPILYDLKLINN